VPEEGGAIAEDKDLTYQFSVLSSQFSVLRKGKTSLCHAVNGFFGFSRSLGLPLRLGVATELTEN
jgi:hypothetical protein